MSNAAFARKRADLTEQLVALAQAEGFGRFALRDLAAALGTSDRMLLYYFKSKAELVRAVLRRVSERLGAALAGADAANPMAPDRFLVQAMRQLGDPAISPLARIWAEAVARGARGEAPYDQAADAAIGQWMDWIGGRLEGPPGPAKTGLAGLLLAFFEGTLLLELARPGSTRGAVETLQKLLAGGISSEGAPPSRA